MKVFDGIEEYERKADKEANIILVIGMFDGMHCAHRKLFEAAKSFDGTVLAFTFSTHFTDENGNRKEALYTKEEKLQTMKDMGIDQVIMEVPSKEFTKIDAHKFMEMIKEKIDPKKIVVGFDFTFGKDALGTPKLFQEYFDGVYIVDKLEKDGVKISSTLLREYLSLGDMESYKSIAKDCYKISGTVVHGFGIGKTKGVPTLNIDIPKEKAVPIDGVYIVRTIIDNNSYQSICNLGNAPTFNRENELLEVHVLDFHEEIYDSYVTVEFLKRIRNVEKFNTTDELYERIVKDIEETRYYFKTLEK